MKKKTVVVIVVFLVISLIGFACVYKYDKYRAKQYVTDFLQLSYNCNAENVEQVVMEQGNYYEKTLLAAYEEHPAIDPEYIIETNQSMELLSDIHTTCSRDSLHNMVVKASFVVLFKDNDYPQGEEQELQLTISLIKTGIGEYKITYIGE